MDATKILIAATFVAGGYIILKAATKTESDGSEYTEYTDFINLPDDIDLEGEYSFTDSLMASTKTLLGIWTPPAKYAGMIAAAERAQGLPEGMLARLLFQECRWREDIITGRVRSKVGAMGMAQFMPATAAEMGIDPLDPAQAIPAAARYLARLYRSLGTWTKALAAYNWGIGNVNRKGIAAAPTETRLYYSQILGDVNAATGSAWA